MTYGEKLSEAEIEPLRRLYDEIRAKDHSQSINRWCWEKPELCPAETPFPIMGLMYLFNQLGELGIAPFNDGAVGPMRKPESLDWSKLPDSLHYLIEPAEKYGSIQFEEKIYELLQSRMMERERDELRALGQRFVQDGKAIDRWLDEFRMTEHPEAARVYFLGELLALGNDAGLL